MTVIRTRPQKEFVCLKNSVLQDSKLSMEAIGLWAHCMSRPEDWTFHVSQLCIQFNIGKNKLYKIINEIIEAGYALRVQIRKQKEGALSGKRPVFSGIEYVFFGEKLTEDEKKNIGSQFEIHGFKKYFPFPQNGDTVNEGPEIETLQRTDSSSYKKTDKKENKEKSAAPPPSAEAEILCEFFLQKIKERNPNFKEPNLKKWTSEFDCLLRLDKRLSLDVKCLIEWISNHSFWKANCISPSGLRKHFDKMLMQMQADSEKMNEEENRRYALECKKKFPDILKNLTISQKYAMNLGTGKEVPFFLPQESFRNAFISMFGGRYEPNRQNE